jgi:hypothetical protein
MKRLKNVLTLLILLFLSCNYSKNTNEKIKPQLMIDTNLLNHVKLAINPKYQDWVLFENGTYIIFDDADTISNLESEAIKLMKEFGPVYAGGFAGDFNVISLTETLGWVVSGHGYGMYTYVHPNELNSEKPDDLTIGLYGRSKRNSDGKHPVVFHVNRKTK